MLSDQWLENSFNLLKVQCCNKAKKFLGKHERLEVYKPQESYLSAKLGEVNNNEIDRELINSILPWLPSRGFESFRELRRKNPKTLYIIPQFHFHI